MPLTGPGTRQDVVATKAVAHGKPVIEHLIPGIAFKAAQAAPAYPTVANAVAAQQIAIGEDFVIDFTGAHEVAAADLPGGGAASFGSNAVGTPLWITSADNTLAAAAGSGKVKFGVITELDTVHFRALVNFNLRDTF